MQAWGHTSLFASKCADQAIGRYLLTSRTPARGTVCTQDIAPFKDSIPVAKVAPDPIPAVALSHPAIAVGW